MRIIAGPCQHESFEQSLEIAEHCAAACANYGIDYYFKASFDKANRTSVSGARGVGLEETMDDFGDLKYEFSKQDLPDLKILTDVHDWRKSNAR